MNLDDFMERDEQRRREALEAAGQDHMLHLDYVDDKLALERAVEHEFRLYEKPWPIHPAGSDLSAAWREDAVGQLVDGFLDRVFPGDGGGFDERGPLGDEAA